MAVYTFGTYTLNAFSGGVGSILLSKTIDLPQVAPITFPIARFDGVIKSGELVKERTITVVLRVIGSSRLDLISKLDALMQALAVRGQSLCIHEDGRLWTNVDAIAAPIKLAPGGIVQADVTISFLAYGPYAIAAASSSFDTGNVTLTGGSGIWNFATISVTAGGNVYAYPQIRIYNRTSSSPTQWSSLSLVQNQDSTTLSLVDTSSAHLPSLNGDYLDIWCDPTVTNGWQVQKNGSGVQIAPSGLFPVLEPGTTTFNITINSTNAVVAEAVITWTNRYLN